jgi:cytochrome c
MTKRDAFSRIALAAAALMLMAEMASAQQPPNVQRGLTLVRTHCGGCHAIDKVSPSRLAAAPPFRTLHERYPVENLEEPLAEGIVTGHPAMPEFSFDPDQVGDIIAYLKSLEH